MASALPAPEYPVITTSSTRLVVGAAPSPLASFAISQLCAVACGSRERAYRALRAPLLAPRGWRGAGGGGSQNAGAVRAFARGRRRARLEDRCGHRLVAAGA